MFKSLWENISGTASKSTALILKENTLFQDLTQRELNFVTNVVHIRNYRADENIFHQGLHQCDKNKGYHGMPH